MKKLLINSLNNFENSSRVGVEGKQSKAQNTAAASSAALQQQHVCSPVTDLSPAVSNEKLSGFLAWWCQSRTFVSAGANYCSLLLQALPAVSLRRTACF